MPGKGGVLVKVQSGEEEGIPAARFVKWLNCNSLCKFLMVFREETVEKCLEINYYIG